MKTLSSQLPKLPLFSLGFILCLSWQSSFAADVYRQVDAEGNVTFSDQPKPGAEKIEVAPTNVHNFPKAPAANPLSKETAKKATYGSLTISSPANDTTIRDPGDVLISAKVRPALRKTHNFLYSDNGQPVDSPTRSQSMQLINLSRGTHVIQVDVVDADNKILISSKPISIHVHRTSIINSEPPKKKETPKDQAPKTTP